MGDVPTAPSWLVSWLATVAAVIAGWALNEISQYIRVRREDRRTTGPVLAELFEIRHRLVALDAYMNELRARFQIPAQAEAQLKQCIQAFIPEPTSLVEGYEHAVSMIARADPFLAFRLRNQPLFHQVMNRFRDATASDQAASQLWSMVLEPKLVERFRPHLEELILDVAWVHGCRTWWRARQRLRREALSQSDKDWISELLSKAQEAPGTIGQG